MKKSKLFLVVPALLGLFLTSCGGENTSSVDDSSDETTADTVVDSSDAETTESTTAEETSPWGNEQSELMKEHLYGEVLPYHDFGEMQVVYSESDDAIFIDGEEVAAGEISEYAKLYTEADGWKGGDISEANSLPVGSAYTFTKKVSTAEGDRYVYVEFFALEYFEDEDSYYVSSKGNFHLNAYDPYFYEFPVEVCRYFAYYSTTAYDSYNEDQIVELVPIPPAYEADYYGINSSARGIYCFGENPTGTDDAGYSAMLTEAGWTVKEEKDKDGFYVAVSPDENFQIAYLFDEEYEDLDIYFEEYKAPTPVYDSWQADIIAEIYEGYNVTPVEIPSLDVEGASYKFYENEDNFWNYIFDDYELVVGYIEVSNVTEQDFAAYTDKVALSWTVAPEGNSFVATLEVETNIYKFSAAYNDGVVLITFNIIPEEKPYETWPTEKVAEAVANTAEVAEGAEVDILPAYEQECLGFKINGNVITVLVEEGSEANAISYYSGVLANNSFVLDEDSGTYYSPNEQYLVSVSEGYEKGVVEIYLGNIPKPIPKFDHFPSDELASFYGTDSKDRIPELNGADEYELLLSDSTDGGDCFGTINCVFKGEDLDLSNKVSEYNQILEEAGFTSYSNYGEGGYISPNEEFVIRAEFDPSTDKYDGYSVLTISFDNIIDGNI